MAELLLNEGAAPSTPSTGKVSLYAKVDGLLYSKDDTGAETPLAVSGDDLAGLGGLTQDQILNAVSMRA